MGLGATPERQLLGEMEDAGVAIEPEAAEPSSADKLMLLANWAGDLSHALDDDMLDRIGARVVEDYETDRADREEWTKVVEEALRLAAQEMKGETKTYPWPGASNINYPLLITAALQFNARSYPAIVKGDEAVSVKVVGADKGRPMLGPDGQPVLAQGANGQPEPQWAVRPGGKAARAQRVREYMNTTLFYRMEDWEADTDTLLFQLPIVGSGFRKVWYDPQRDQHRAAVVPALRIFMPKEARSCETTPRLTEEVPDQFPADILAQQAAGHFRMVDLWQTLEAKPGERLANFDREPRLLLEQHRLLDLDEDGLPEPYVVTVDHETRRVLRIEPNFGPESVTAGPDGGAAMIRPGRHYIAYTFIPDPNGGPYGWGLGHLLRQIGSVVDTIVNQMLDAGQAQVAGGGFIGSGVRVNGTGRTGNVIFEPGKYRTVDVPGNQLREAIVERTAPQPSQILYSLLDMMLGAARDISSVKDVITGEASNNGQVGTTLALIEQGLQVFTAIYKRVYRALRQEYALLFENMARYATDQVRDDYRATLDDDAADFDADFNQSDMDIRPVSDPQSVTKMQKLARAQFLGQFANLPWVNGPEVTKRMWEAADVEDADALLVPPQLPQPDPLNVATANEKQSRAALNEQQALTEVAKREQMAVDAFAKGFGVQPPEQVAA